MEEIRVELEDGYVLLGIQGEFVIEHQVGEKVETTYRPTLKECVEYLIRNELVKQQASTLDAVLQSLERIEKTLETFAAVPRSRPTIEDALKKQDILTFKRR